VNRAEKLLAVLQDGRPHSRREIQERVGYFLTNNAASELRAKGYDVSYRREGRVDVYQLTTLAEGDSAKSDSGPGTWPQDDGLAPASPSVSAVPVQEALPV
jgi:biotin operon repressor